MRAGGAKGLSPVWTNTVPTQRVEKGRMELPVAVSVTGTLVSDSTLTMQFVVSVCLCQSTVNVCLFALPPPSSPPRNYHKRPLMGTTACGPRVHAFCSLFRLPPPRPLLPLSHPPPYTLLSPFHKLYQKLDDPAKSHPRPSPLCGLFLSPATG